MNVLKVILGVAGGILLAVFLLCAGCSLYWSNLQDRVAARTTAERDEAERRSADQQIQRARDAGRREEPALAALPTPTTQPATRPTAPPDILSASLVKTDVVVRFPTPGNRHSVFHVVAYWKNTGNRPIRTLYATIRYLNKDGSIAKEVRDYLIYAVSSYSNGIAPGETYETPFDQGHRFVDDGSVNFRNGGTFEIELGRAREDGW